MNFLLSIFYFLLPFERIPTFEVAGFTVKFSHIVGVILIAYFLAKKPLKIFKDKPLLLSDKFLILFWAVGSLTIIRAENFKRSAILALLWAFVIIIYLILTRIIENQKTREKIENIIIWSAIITSLFGLYQFIGDSFDLPTKFTGLRYWYTKEIADLGFPRIQSVALEPLYFSNFLLVPLYLAIKRYFKSGKIFGDHYLIIVLILINIVLGISRGAYLGLVVTLVLLLLFIIAKWKVYKTLKPTLFGLGLAIIISVFLSYVAVNSLNGKDAAANFRSHAIAADSEEGNSVSGRMESYREAWKLFKTNPVMGIGLGNFGASHTYNGDASETNYSAVNNEYLEILTEIGIVGLVLFLLFLIFFVKELYNGYKKTDDKGKLWTVLLFLGLVAVFIQYNFFSSLYIIYIWAFLALLRSEIIEDK